MIKLRNFAVALALVLLLGSAFTACDNNKSYADLLNEETRSINRYLADQQVIGSVPADSLFITGPDAPYYRMDPDGLVYMRVITTGDMSQRAQKNDLVYIRFTRYNLNYYTVPDSLPSGDGNAEDVSYSEQFRYQNVYSQSSQQWGEGIQVPLNYLGYGCEVDLVIRSQSGRGDEVAQVIPYMYNVRYYRSRI